MARCKTILTISSATALALLAVRLVSSTSSVPVHAGAGEATYASELAAMNTNVAAWQARLDTRATSWIEHERAANAYLQRARLSGNWRDYAIADSLVARAFEIAPLGAGPFLSRARLNFTLHRFDRVEADLARAESVPLVNARTRDEIVALRADVAFETGRVEDAIAAYEMSASAKRDFESIVRLAGGYTKVGPSDEADRLYEEALRILPTSSARVRAWVCLQRGLLDLEANHVQDALSHYLDADRSLPGWWMVREHIAEAYARLGETEHALSMYREILAGTPDPEFMDAVARIYRDRGDTQTAATWIAKAKHGHSARLVMFPEAARGHAEQHIRDFGPIRG